MEFAVLGPLQVASGGMQLHVGGKKVRTLLAILACNANEVVATERLLDALWGDKPPASAAQNLRVYVYHLRRLLGSDRRISWQPLGYRLLVEPGELDADVFEDLATRGLAALDHAPDRASMLLRRAVGSWRGPALADLADVPALAPVAARLEERRLTILSARIEADLALGRHAALVAELTELVAAHPLREHLRAQLMRALSRSGRRAEALTAYREGRRILVEELGVEPGPELQGVHRAVLADTVMDADADVADDDLEAAAGGDGELEQIRTALRTLTHRLERVERRRGSAGGRGHARLVQ
jgi:DNA-binding SARP family transcriptional activator